CARIDRARGAPPGLLRRRAARRLGGGVLASRRRRWSVAQLAFEPVWCLVVFVSHAGTASRSFESPSCSGRRAASSEQPIARAISRCGRSARKRSTTAERCLLG